MKYRIFLLLFILMGSTVQAEEIYDNVTFSDEIVEGMLIEWDTYQYNASEISEPDPVITTLEVLKDPAGIDVRTVDYTSNMADYFRLVIDGTEQTLYSETLEGKYVSAIITNDSEGVRGNKLDNLISAPGTASETYNGTRVGDEVVVKTFIQYTEDIYVSSEIRYDYDSGIVNYLMLNASNVITKRSITDISSGKANGENSVQSTITNTTSLDIADSSFLPVDVIPMVISLPGILIIRAIRNKQKK